MFNAPSLFDYHRFAHARLFQPDQPVWTALQQLRRYMDDYPYPAILPPDLIGATPLVRPVIIHESNILPASGLTIEYGDTLKGGLRILRDDIELEGAALIMAGAILLGNKISIGRGSLIEGGATIKAPAIIGAHTEVRQGAYLRGYSLIGDRCVVGHATEVKHAIFFDDAKAGHFAYLGDSILGNDTNLGAGTKCANLKFLRAPITFELNGTVVETGMRKFGAIFGDHAQTGCNSVTNPGTIIGKSGILMPNTTSPSGYHPEGALIR